jgi:hypothetical protein
LVPLIPGVLSACKIKDWWNLKLISISLYSQKESEVHKHLFVIS